MAERNPGDELYQRVNNVIHEHLEQNVNKLLEEENKPYTNADRIRSMTDEELAEWINRHDCHTNIYGYDPKDAMLDWLRQEVTP